MMGEGACKRNIILPGTGSMRRWGIDHLSGRDACHLPCEYVALAASYEDICCEAYLCLEALFPIGGVDQGEEVLGRDKHGGGWRQGIGSAAAEQSDAKMVGGSNRVRTGETRRAMRCVEKT